MPEHPKPSSPEAERSLEEVSYQQRSARDNSRWSFGGAEPIETAAGVLYPRLLVARPGHAVLHTVLTGFVEKARTDSTEGLTEPLSAAIIDATALIDDRGTPYDLRLERMAGRMGKDRKRGPASLRLAVSPVPPQERAWLELRGETGSTTRMRPSARPHMHVSQTAQIASNPAEQELSQQALRLISLRLAGADRGTMERRCYVALTRAAKTRHPGESSDVRDLRGQLTRLCALLTGYGPGDGLPPAWSTMLDAEGRTDGVRLHLDISAALPSLAGMAIRVDGLVSEPGSWDLCLHAEPGWWALDTDRQRKRAVTSVHAEDDLGGWYLSQFGGSNGDGNQEEVIMTFRPRLNAQARALTLTFAAASEQVALELRLP